MQMIIQYKQFFNQVIFQCKQFFNENIFLMQAKKIWFNFFSMQVKFLCKYLFI